MPLFGLRRGVIGGDELVVEPANVARQLERDPLAFDLDPLDGLPARREASGEVEQPVELASVRADSQLADHGLAVVELRCGVGPLVGVYPDDEHEALMVAQPMVDPTAGTPDEVDYSRLFRATHSENPTSGPLRSEANQ